ncbi:MAG TPA: hypothetical protein VGX76_00950 [Pirellulales bacterium]|jgi:hypothetical protein|nr:hypothetical protein [Pirellulales bacterium]
MSNVFDVNTAGLERLRGALVTASEAALGAAERTLRVWGEEYRRRLAAASPSAHGELAASWRVVVEPTDRGFSVTVGTNLRGNDGQPYPLFLELGTALIAGGRVAAWEPGEGAVVDWPAKSRGERKRAAAGGGQEQMPLVRPIGYEIAQSSAETTWTMSSRCTSIPTSKQSTGKTSGSRPN